MKLSERINLYIQRLDKLLVILCAVLSVASVILLRSIVINNAMTVSATSSLYKTQALISGASLLIALVMSFFDYSKIIKLYFLYAPVAIILSLLVFTPLGIEVADDKAWLDLKFITIQPSELLKITFITTFALHLSKVGDELNNFGNFLLLCFHAAIPTGIVILQGDDGTAVVFMAIFAIMMFSAGLSLKYILPILIALPIGLYAVWNYVMKDFQKMRFLVLFNDELDPLGIGYHQRMSKLALGSGLAYGKGLHASEYVKVPEVVSDFIFTYIGQCFGFVGCVAVIVIFMVLTIKILLDSFRTRDLLGKYICIGVYAMIVIHCVLNLGMVFGVMPVIGVPLPFLSQGGTSALATYIGIGLVLSTNIHREKKDHMVLYNDNQ